ncbi:MAG: Crp/Fnr family transcriptional regulator [Armatimonadota bacterium]
MPHTKTPRDLVHEFPFFAGLDEQTYDELLAGSTSRRVEKGETLFLDGEHCRGMFLVQSGVIKIYKLSESGKEQILTLARPGDAVAELPLFDGGDYPASAGALEDSVVLFVPATLVNELLEHRPQLCRSVIAALAKRLRKLVCLVEDLSLRHVRERLARLLLEEAGGKLVFHLAFTNEELAARLGSVRDVISRTMSALQAEGLIRLEGRRVEILSPHGLAELAGE